MINTIVKSIAIFAMIAFALPTLVGQEENVDPNVERLIVPFRNSEGKKSLEAQLMRGSITVIGYEGDEVIVDAVRRNAKTSNNATNGMRIYNLPSTGIYVEELNNKVVVGSSNHNATIDVTIKVPFEISIRVKCINSGNIHVEKVVGEIEAENLNGKIKIIDSGGAVIAHALNGSIHVDLLEVFDDKPMSFTSLNGSIDVSMPENTKANLKLHSANGNLKSDFDIAILPEQKKLKVSDGRSSGGRYRLEFEQGIHGTINGGGPHYRFKTHNGQIYLRKYKKESNTER